MRQEERTLNKGCEAQDFKKITYMDMFLFRKLKESISFIRALILYFQGFSFLMKVTFGPIKKNAPKVGAFLTCTDVLKNNS